MNWLQGEGSYALLFGKKVDGGKRGGWSRAWLEEEWQLHVKRDHLPYRKDCRHCIQAASGRPHRRTSHRSAYVLSIDVAGPFRDRGKDMGGSKYKVMLVASYQQFPKLPETATSPPAKEVEAEMGGGELESDIEDLVQELEQLFEEEGIKSAKKEEVGRSKEESKPAEPDDEKKKEEEKLRKEAEEASEPFEFNTAYFVRGMTGRKTGEALSALQEIYIDLRALGFPVARVHCDRAREFRTAAVAEWAAARDIQLTRTEGDGPAQNWTAEQAVKYVKAKVRVLLSQALELSGRSKKEVKTWWLLAAETVVARQRAMLFGRSTPSMAPFGGKVFIKRKRYGTKGEDLEVKWGPGLPGIGP